MSNNIFYLAFLFLVVATSFVIVFFIRKHPEKISIFKVEGSENEIIDKTKWVNLLCRMMVIGNFITLIGGIVAVCLENILMFSFTTVQRNFPIRSTDHHRSHSEDVWA